MRKFKDQSTVVFTMDVDWVKDDLLSWAIGIFKEEGLPVTVFATHGSSVLTEEREDIEIGIHPNFFARAKKEEEILKGLLKCYPEARGVRAHGLFEYSGLLSLYKKCNLAWDSSQLLYLCKNIFPYRHPSGLVRLPIFWEDDDYISNSPDWRIEGLELQDPGVKCFDFHPAHLYLNSPDLRGYAAFKRGALSSEIAKGRVYKGKRAGVLVFFQKLCRYIKRNRIRVARAGEVCSWV